MCIMLGTAACWATMTACDSIDLNAIDWDGDGVPDVTDAFPVDPTEDTDSDGDGVGDNSDDFPTDPRRSRATLINVFGGTDNDAVSNDTDAVSNDTDTGNAIDNSSDESPPPDVNPPPDANPPSSNGGGGDRRKSADVGPSPTRLDGILRARHQLRS